MFSFFKKKTKEKSCTNCIHYNKKEKRCTVTRNSTLKNFPFKNTTCKTYKQK